MKIAVLPGDGIGEEVMAAALQVLAAISDTFGHRFSTTHGLIGGAAWERYGTHFPAETEQLCRESDAILFGSVGGPVQEQHLEKWKGCEAHALLGLRKTFSFNVNLRPSRVYHALERICPLKPEIIGSGIDVLVVRELLGDIYFGEHHTSTRTLPSGEMVRHARDVAEYDERQIASVAHWAFKAACQRRKKLTSIDKANVLDIGKLWRVVVNEVAKSYPEVTLEHMLVDNAAMQLIRAPSSFDVLLTPNMFGDILSDEAAVFPGSLGLTPSASLNSQGFGMYEPSGGSAPDIAGKGIANPIAQILSLALMLRLSFNLEREANVIERAVETVLRKGMRTKDIFEENTTLVGTKEMAGAIAAEVRG